MRNNLQVVLFMVLLTLVTSDVKFKRLPVYTKLQTSAVSVSADETNKRGDDTTAQLLYDIANYESALTSALAGYLQHTFTDIKELIQGLLKSLESNEPKITGDTEVVLSKLTDRIVSAVEAFSGKLLDATDALLRHILSSIEQNLFKVNTELVHLAKNIDEQFDWAVTHLNESLMNNTENIDLWTANIKQKLRSVNDTRLYKEGCQVVDDFIQRTSTQLQGCCNVSIKPVLSLCRSTRALLSEAFYMLADVIDRMQTCLEDKNSYLEYMVPCINLAYDDVNALIGQAVQLRHKIDSMLPLNILYSKYCISIVLVEMKERQNQVKADLLAKNII